MIRKGVSGDWSLTDEVDQPGCLWWRYWQSVLDDVDPVYREMKQWSRHRAYIRIQGGAAALDLAGVIPAIPIESLSLSSHIVNRCDSSQPPAHAYMTPNTAVVYC